MKVIKFLISILSTFLIILINIYRKFISPLFPPMCRFRPTCSEYALEAIKIHGPFKGLYLTVRRLFKCHPFHPGGFDPVPPKNDKEKP